MSNETKVVRQDPPVHPFEVRINIGANERPFIVRALRELADQFEKGGGGSFSGGWHGCYSSTITTRDVTPEHFRMELAMWAEEEAHRSK